MTTKKLPKYDSDKIALSLHDQGLIIFDADKQIGTITAKGLQQIADFLEKNPEMTYLLLMHQSMYYEWKKKIEERG